MLLRKIYYLRKAVQRSHYSKKQLKNFQNKKLRALITHAYKFVPFYRRKWKKLGIRPEKIKNSEDLKKLPIIKKEDVRKNYEDFIAVNYKKWYRLGKMEINETSGTTGEPFQMFFDERASDFKDSIYLRSLMSVGYNPKKELVIYWYEPFREKLYNKFGYLRKKVVLCNLSEEKQMKILKKLKPEYLYYFSSSIFNLSRINDDLNPKLIITQAEVLSKNMKKRIENSFNCPVRDTYACAEASIIAWQCEEGNYHINSDSVILEGLKDAESEKTLAIITPLFNYMVPLIRYNIKDIIKTGGETCECGRNFPIIKSIEGRKEKLIRLKNEKIITERYLIDKIAGIEEIDKFQIFYEGNDRFSITVKSKCNLKELEKKINKIIKYGVKIGKGKIEKSKRGKIELLKIN